MSNLENICLKTINIIKSISALDWGANQESILRVYKSLVRSRLDYSAIVYDSAAPSNIKILDPIANEALRSLTKKTVIKFEILFQN